MRERATIEQPDLVEPSRFKKNALVGKYQTLYLTDFAVKNI